ncbi:putative UDP-glucuronosyl/UDP-glucosyltransferase [Medicago truncatula]|uniref:Glycosyltransferase n=1 Tax=Medicago truncatula TaxID=3880 RepID=A0A072U929_MEDTR|nr:scopoletin glucosyltransferase [Medicago truncatula]KEH25851.1 UDP-glucosyltransferase family protein [Medicago truncatula]RHN51021.1 putative UDP-glucuronosyl/UDP-glucosyltransferase [Medicago truncatula]
MEGVEVERPLKLHFIPFPAPGHMIPMCKIATLFASRGHHVTIITTPSNTHFFTNKNSSFAIPFFHLHTVDFPFQEVGLANGIESLSSTADLTTATKINSGLILLQGPIGDFLEKDPPDYIIVDCIYPGVYDLADKLHIPTIGFTVMSLFTVSLLESLRTTHLLHPHTDSDLDSHSFVVPNFPHHITLCTKPPKMFTIFLEMMLETIHKSNRLIVNSFTELDGKECVEHYEKIMGHKAWHLGPHSLICETVQEKAERGNESVVSVHECQSWLNSKQENSVLYICFGSLCNFSDKQLYEISCGIEASGKKFIWVVPEKKGKEDESDEEKEKWLPKGFEERNIRRNKMGLIIRGWAPQVLILSHPAVGAFMTHCGWNSVVEAVSAGIPMITWPVHGEHFYNEKLITNVRGIGVEVGATEWCLYDFGKKKVVSRDNIEKAVRRLINGSSEAKEIRQRARELGEKARLAVQQGGSSNNNLLSLVDDLKRWRDIRKTLD